MDWKALWKRVDNLLLAAVAMRDVLIGGHHRGQFAVHDGEGKGGIRILTPYGLAVRLVPAAGDDGPETVLLAVESNLRYALPPADARFAPDGMEAGETMLHDDLGQRVYLTREGLDFVSPARIRLMAPKVEVHAAEHWLVNVGGYADKLTHVSEGQLVSETWHLPAIVTPEPDHGYKHPDPE